MLCKGSMQYQLRQMNTSQTVDRQSHSVVNRNHARLMQHLRLKQEYHYFKNTKQRICIDTCTGKSQWLRYRMTLLVTLKSHLVHRWVDDWIDCFRRGENGPPFIDYCTGGLVSIYVRE